MIKWADDRERVFDKLDKIEDGLSNLKAKLFAIASSVSIIIGLGFIFIEKLF